MIFYALTVTCGDGFVYAKDYVSEQAALRRGEKLVKTLIENAQANGFDLPYAYTVRKVEIREG